MAVLLPFRVRGVAGLPLRVSFKTDKTVVSVDGLIPALEWTFSDGILEITGKPAAVGHFEITVNFDDGTSQKVNFEFGLEAF